VGKGTGLGLSLAYGIIKQHNGYINCYSESGRGTTFRIYLPIIDAAIDRVSRKSIESVRGGTETILLAEDDVQVRTSTRKFLEQFGYMVIEAVDGNDALMQFRASGNKVQLALLDVIMPGINGKEVFAEMKMEAPDLKVLFTSGYSADVFRCEEIGGPGVPFISKPANLFELLKMIRLLLDGKC